MPRAVVVDVQPVADVEPVAVQRHRPAVEQVGDEQRDDLLRELVRPVVVGAAGDAHVEAVGAGVGQGEQVAARLARRVRRVRLQRVGLRPRAVTRSSRTPRRWTRGRSGPGRGAGAASSSDWVPTTFVMTKSAAPAMERSTCDSAAKWTTASAAGTSSSRRAPSRMSPSTKRRRGLSRTSSRLARLPAYVSLSRTTTSAPSRPGYASARARRTKCEPMKPAPPVTSTCMTDNSPGRRGWTRSSLRREAACTGPTSPLASIARVGNRKGTWSTCRSRRSASRGRGRSRPGSSATRGGSSSSGSPSGPSPRRSGTRSRSPRRTCRCPPRGSCAACTSPTCRPGRRST